MTSNKNLISQTLARRMMTCIEEYERIKKKESIVFKTVKDFCIYNNFSHQNFMKIYHRYKQNPNIYSLIPQKRGPKYKIKRTDINIENRIIELRKKGNNRFDIRNILYDEFKTLAPCYTTIYNICKKHGLNKLKQTEKTERRKIIMSKIGELVHIDCHELPKGITIKEADKKLYLIGMIDDYSRIAWADVIEDKKALTVMFATLRLFHMLKSEYGIETECIMSDNGAEFGSGKNAKNKENHPFERLLMEMQIKHTYTKPYTPKTNGKIERFWKTLKEDFLDDALYNDIDDLKEELLGFIVYYNEHRAHCGLNGKCPVDFAKKCN